MYPAATDAIVQGFPTSTVLLAKLSDAPKLVRRLVKIWKKDAKSSQFASANTFADFLPAQDDYADILLDGKDALDILAGVVQAAEWNARRAKAMRAEKFKSAPKTRELAVVYISTHPEQADKVVGNYFPEIGSASFLEAELTDQ